MERIGASVFMIVCLFGIVAAQVDEVPAASSESVERSQVGPKGEINNTVPAQDSANAMHRDLSKPESRQMRQFVTINFMIIIIIILIIALALFLIVNRTRRSKNP